MTPAKMFDGDLWVLASDVMQLAENAYKNGQTDEREAIDQLVNDDKDLSDNDAIRISKVIRARGNT